MSVQLKCLKSAISLVALDWFSKPYSESTKMTWFHFQYAREMFEQIEQSRIKTLRKWRNRHSKEQIAEFCAYYSKRMQPCMYDIVEGYSEKLTCEVSYVHDFCHTNSRQENTDLATLAQQAMSVLLDKCNECTYLCLLEPGEECEYIHINS